MQAYTLLRVPFLNIIAVHQLRFVARTLCFTSLYLSLYIFEAFILHV